MSTSSEDRSALALAMAWAYHGTSISLQMVVPGVIGIWIDSWLQSSPIFTIAGFGLGLVLGIWSLTRLKAPGAKPREKEPPSERATESGVRPSTSEDKSSLHN